MHLRWMASRLITLPIAIRSKADWMLLRLLRPQ